MMMLMMMMIMMIMIMINNYDATCRVDSCVSSYLRPNERVTGNSSSSETYILLHRRSISRVCSRSSQLLSCCMEA